MISDRKLTIGKVDYPIFEEELRQSDLSFYPENPRVYSLLNVSSGIPDQDEIQSIMIKYDHVKQLRVSIKDNGGLIDPLIVRKKVVLEGNSRLAAYRLLALDDPIKWGYVKCQILPDDFPDEAVFILLGQYHVSGKTNWSPFEQAGFLTRQTRVSGRPIGDIATVLGIQKGDARRYVQAYELMEKHDDLKPTHWSYYEEYLKSRSIKRYRDVYPNMDDVIVKQIKSGEIREAIDVRKKLGEIAKSDSREAKRIMQEYIEGDVTLYEGFDTLESSGKIGSAYKTIKAFSEKINSPEFEKMIAEENKSQIKYQLKQTNRRITKLLDKLK